MIFTTVLNILYLIDFSNHAFYDKRLKPAPNNFDYIPINYIQVNGTFADHINDAEAEMVLSIIENNIDRLPNGQYPSIGVATFNIAQRNLIIEKITARKKFDKYKHFNQKIQEMGLDDPKSNKSFIKNLENIQGDERDVIILSTTYGIGKDKKFAQRFGPLNHKKGYKLLNVIITRAKYKVYVCSSIPEQVFMNYKEYLATERANNKRAVFYSYLAYCKAVSEGNNDIRLSILSALSNNTSQRKDFIDINELESPFEEEVYQSLVKILGKERLVKQYQFGGFRIDILYISEKIGVPKIAIECDGAKYHSCREAYLYDTHRQQILEDSGFVFHRIWSTNWWRAPKRELISLIKFITDIESQSRSNISDYSQISSAFTNKIHKPNNYLHQQFSIDNENETIILQNFKPQSSGQIEIPANEIKLNSKVKVKFIKNGREQVFHIVQSTNNHEIINGIQKIGLKSPMASSILQHTIGDIVKIGSLDNFVEIIDILN